MTEIVRALVNVCVRVRACATRQGTEYEDMLQIVCLPIR